ncbi:MAG: GTP 3',8-cyclase MoaA [Gemmatimonadales bacterium]|nr:GTP 3',8-cyclase MoaA [Gemmatimonadales bacterium]
MGGSHERIGAARGGSRVSPASPSHPTDLLGRPLRNLRVSVTDRCNLRCRYCMPESEYVWLPRASILTFEEMDRVAGVFAGLGVAKVRLTGGEPLLRHDLATLVALLARHADIGDLALTTNGVLLERQAAALRDAGLRRVTVSLDTLRPERMREFARSARHTDVVAGIDAARAAGFSSLKLNTVIIRGYNEDEVLDLMEFARGRGAEPRFIEYMDVGGATGWSMDQVVSQREILEVVARRYGPVEPLREGQWAPAERFALRDGTVFGVIASTTAPFCRTCDRARLTADGTFLLCLYGEEGVDLRQLLRGGATDAEISAAIAAAWRARADRGAEERAGLSERGVLHRIESLRADPRREMHTRGG